MGEAARYMFDRSFDAPSRLSEAQAARRQADEAWERKMVEACQAAFDEGREKGRAETMESLEAKTSEQLGELIEGAHALNDKIDKEFNQLRENAIHLAVGTANLLARELIARNPALNAQALFSDALEFAGDAPHIALTVNDAIAETVEKGARAAARERGFTGEIVVLGDPGTKKGDCTLQWADGGVALNFEKTMADVAGVVRRHLETGEAQAAPPAAPAETPSPAASPQQESKE